MLRRLYSALYTVLIPAMLLAKLWRSRRAPEYRRRWAERFGFFATPEPAPCIWVHAVSHAFTQEKNRKNGHEYGSGVKNRNRIRQRHK